MDCAKPCERIARRLAGTPEHFDTRDRGDLHPADTVVRPGKVGRDLQDLPRALFDHPGQQHACHQQRRPDPHLEHFVDPLDRRFHQVGTVIPGSLVVPDARSIDEHVEDNPGYPPSLLRLYAELSAQVPVTLELAATSRCWMSVEFHDARSLLTLSVGMSYACLKSLNAETHGEGERTMTQILDLIGGALGTEAATNGNEPSTPKTLDRLKDILNTTTVGTPAGEGPSGATAMASEPHIQGEGGSGAVASGVPMSLVEPPTVDVSTPDIDEPHAPNGKAPVDDRRRADAG